MPKKQPARRRGSDIENRVHQLIADGDLEALAELVNEQVGSRVVEVDAGGIRSAVGEVATDLDEFRRRLREDPGGALDLVRGPPLAGVDAAWAIPIRAQIRSEIADAAYAACRLDPANSADYLWKALVAAPGNSSLWIARMRVAGESGSMSDLEMVYGNARATYASAGGRYFPWALAPEAPQELIRRAISVRSLRVVQGADGSALSSAVVR